MNHTVIKIIIIKPKPNQVQNQSTVTCAKRLDTLPMNVNLILLTKTGTKQLKIARSSQTKRNLKIIKEKVKITKKKKKSIAKHRV